MRSTDSWITNRAVAGRVLPLLMIVIAAACSGREDVPVEKVSTGMVAESEPEIRKRVTVSGVSSGGYMAVQTHIALANLVSGAGVVAGGPYHCAEGSVGNALGQCMSGENLDVSRLVSFTVEAAVSGNIAAIESLRDSRVWIFHGAKDAIVSSAVAVALVDYYREFLPDDQVKFVGEVDAVHGWPTLNVGRECLVMGGDFINACGFDTAGNLLSYLYENLNPPDTDSTMGELHSMDLSAYFESGSGLSPTGYLFVPENCVDVDSNCRLHIAYHGCRQGAEFIGERFAISSGLNEWAVQNHIVVIYPQIESSPMNPQGCWDWWGYTGPQYDLKAGKQISGIDRIIVAFANGRLFP